jgi:hypothetical protein
MAAAAASPTTLCALPLALLQSILARLPVDARARACAVCPAWNAALAERSLWVRLDLSATSDVAVALTDEVLEAAAARAGGQLEALELRDSGAVSYEALLAVVTASGALRELRWCLCTNWEERTYRGSKQVVALLRAAPQLREFDVNLWCQSIQEASRLLRNEPPCAPLRVQSLTVAEREDEAPDEAAVLAFAAAVAGHAWLAELMTEHVPFNTAASLDALVDAALARRLSAVTLSICGLSPASAPALVRLLGGGLARLELFGMQPLLDVPAALLLSNALRASTALTSLELREIDLWYDPAAAVLLLGALASHQSLRELNVSGNAAGTPALQTIAGDALAALVAANAPTLQTLDISHCSLGDAGLGLVADALPQNTYLHTLMLLRNHITEGFVRGRLLPAVQANTSLRNVVLFFDDYNNDNDDDDDDEYYESDSDDEDDDEYETDSDDDGDTVIASAAIMRELQDLVAARGAAGAPQ